MGELMDDAPRARMRAWLAAPPLRAHDVFEAEALAAALTDPRRAEAVLTVGRHGMTICFSPRPHAGSRRRIFEIDPAGNVVAAVRWDDAGGLAAAVVRTAGGEWIGVEPRATSHPVWGLSDRLWRLGDPPGWERREPLTVFETLDWASIDQIPPLADPARLPPGAGTAVLNLIAALATDQGRPRLRYHGPYATEQLFSALLESFDPLPDPLMADDDLLRHFLEHRLAWRPAPHERHFPQPDLCLQFRGRIEKVLWGGRAYYRREWASVTRRTARAVRDAGGQVHCSLCALGAVIEDHLVLDPEGSVLAIPRPPPDPRAAVPMDRRLYGGLAAIVRASSAPALASAIDAVMAPLSLEWAGLPGDLAAVGPDRIRFAWRLADVAAARVRAAVAAGERLGRALELLTEMAHLIGDAVRSRAQAVLAAASAEAQRDRLADVAVRPATCGNTAGDGGRTAADAARIMAATQALAETLLGGGYDWSLGEGRSAEHDV